MAKPLSLPEPRDEILERSPLSLVVCQVRHQGGAFIDELKAESIHRSIRDDFPDVEPSLEGQLNIKAGSGGVETQQGAPQPFWNFRSKDDWVAVLGQTHFAIETIKYDRWDQFLNRFRSFVKAVVDIGSPSFTERVGLRFVNQIQLNSADSPEKFQGSIKAEVLGPLVGSVLSPSITSTHNSVDLKGPGDIYLKLQHGCQPTVDSISYIVDTDCFRQTNLAFEYTDIVKTVDSFHYYCKQIFEVVITEKLYNYFKGA